MIYVSIRAYTMQKSLIVTVMQLGNVNSVDWNDGNGTVEWTTGVEHWTGLLECHAHKVYAYTVSLPQTS